MPKTVQVPPYIKDLVCEKINENIDEGIIPLEIFKDFSVDLPYTIPADSEFTFTYTFPVKPKEILLENTFRFGDYSQNTIDYDFFKLTLGRVTINLILNNYILISDGVQHKLFYYDPTGDEYSKNIKMDKSSYGDSSSPLYGYSSITNISHICHKDAVGKKIILKEYSVEDNILKIKFLNEETTPIILNKFVSIEPKNNANSILNNDITSKPVGMCTIKDKLMFFGNTFIIRSGMNATWEEEQSNIFVINSNYDNLNYDIGSETTIMSPEHAFVTVDQGSLSSNISYLVGLGPTDIGSSKRYNYGAAGCVKHNNSDEYFAAFMVGYVINSDMRFIMYDSETGTWDLKNSGTFTNSNAGGSNEIHTSINSSLYGPTIATKSMDIKHFQSDGNVHAMVTAFNGVYKPIIIHSKDNMETWTTIFDESKITSSVNSNIISGVINTGNINIDKNLCSKIIDENTMFSQFCSYVSAYDFGYINHFSQVQMLIKTTDGGTSWTDVHQSNPEYTHSPSVCNYISDNGQDIYTIIFYGNGQYSGNYPVSQNNYYPNDGFALKVLFNYSNDGGSTWAYPSGAWKLVEGTNETSGFPQTYQFKFNLADNYVFQRYKNQTSVYYNKTTNEIIVGYGTLEGREYINFKISRDNGNTWESPHSPILENHASVYDGVLMSSSSADRTIVPYIGEGYKTPINCSAANDLFCAFYVYTSIPQEVNIKNVDNIFSVHDYIFESTSYGFDGISPAYENTRMHSSSIFITHTNTSAKITKIKGYYL